MPKEKNCLMFVRKTNKNGKKYENIVCRVKLDNGREAVVEVKLAFYNRKLASLLALNLPIEDTSNGKKDK